MESILTTIKKMLDVAEENRDFDDVLIIHINSVFATLHQLGVGPKEGYFIVTEENKWSEFIPANSPFLLNIKTYIALKVKLVFDPPQNGTLIESIKNQILENEVRLMMAAETEGNCYGK